MTMTPAIREQSFYVLAALWNGPRHGYGIIQETGRFTGGEVQLAPGTLYGALDRLSEGGLVEDDHEEVVEGRVRRYMRLTEEGRRLVVAEAQRMETAARLVLDRASTVTG
jgi:DNA-binding PadR family transcriptional regulator